MTQLMNEAPSPDALDLRTAIRQWQEETLTLALPVVYALGLLLILIPIHRNPLQAAIPGLWLVLIASGSWLLRGFGHGLASGLLVTGVGVVAGLLWLWGHVLPAGALLLFTTGLATILLGFVAGSAVALLQSAALLFFPALAVVPDPSLRWLVPAQSWGIVWLMWLGARPLLSAMQWFHASYVQSRDLLQQARDNQLLLNQTLADLADAHSQLTRLNQLSIAMRQLAEEARQAKEQFVANVSHEFRTPLNIILGFIEMIMQAPETYGRRVPRALLADLSVVLRNGKHLSDLIDDVLDLSQIETGRMALTKERVVFADIVEAALLAVGPLYESKRLYLRAEVAPDLPPIYCDQVRIRQVLLNVLSNAGRFTESGGVELCARQADGNLVVSIADTGPGIAEADLEKVFQPFQQGDNSIRRRYGGSGLGLNISKAFVELHDGKMWVESCSGCGLTVYFSLPLASASPAFAGALRWINQYGDYYPRTRPSLAPIPSNRPRLVVLEAGHSFERLLIRYLGDVEVVHTTSFAEAVEESTRVPTQAILINDWEIGAHFKPLEETAQPPYGTPVIHCTVPGPQESAELLGVSDYLIKPVARERLLAAIERVAPAAATVLLVDDDPDALLLFRRMLASTGRDWRVIRAENGQQALQALEEQRPDLVLLDLVMPGMDGFQFLTEKHARPDLAMIPVLVISAQDPLGQPIVNRTLAVTHSGGISTHQLLGLIEASVHLLSAQKTRLSLDRSKEIEPADRLAQEAAGAQR